MLCQRCGQREAEIFLSHLRDDGLHSVDLCAICAKRDQGLVLGALIQAQTPGAPPLSEVQEEAVRRAIDRVGEIASDPAEIPSDPDESSGS